MTNQDLDSHEKFSDCVENYAQFRPDYPSEILTRICSRGWLNKDSHVVDWGCGTGSLSKIFLQAGIKVTGVEPNENMRAMADVMLQDESQFISVPGSAEKSELLDKSVDLVVCGQAFHWFNPILARREWIRICTVPRAVLVWNERRMDDSFMYDYDVMLRQHCSRYKALNGSHVVKSDIDQFFGSKQSDVEEIENFQMLGLDGMIGKVASASYSLVEGEQGYTAFQAHIKHLFNTYCNDQGYVTFKFITRIFLGQN